MFQSFTPGVWGAMYLAASILSLALAVMYHTYKRTHEMKHMISSNSSEVPLTRILMLPLSNLTAPVNIIWFPTWSTGETTLTNLANFIHFMALLCNII